MSTIDIVQIAASVFVLISFLMRRMWAIRVINIIGCSLFVAAGIVLNVWSLWLLNGMLVIIHIIYLIFSRNKKKSQNGRLASFNQSAFEPKSLRKPSWFLTSRGDDLSDW